MHTQVLAHIYVRDRGSFMRKAKAPSSIALNHDGCKSLGAPVEVRRHPSARRLTLRVSRTRRAVIVTLPPQCDLDEADSFINRNIAWVRERLENLPRPVAFLDGAFIPLRGETHRIAFTKSGAGSGVVTRLARPTFPELHVAGSNEHAPRRLAEWLYAEARRDLDDAVTRHARTLKLRPKKIVVRDQASRWGSCSTTGALSFSWRLVMAPPYILDYVAAHEVAHLQEMNHGPKFWALVRLAYPDLDRAKRWLQIYGMDLHRYG
jgi:predicted metal-dependent hydrolase